VTWLLSFLSCLACFGGPVKDRNETDKRLARRPARNLLDAAEGCGPWS
jgi:hypothetical protein